MTEELENLWEKLSLTEKKLTEVCIEQDWLEEAKEVGKNCLIGKLLLNKRVNIETMKNVFYNVWKISLRMVVREMGNRIFVFQFQESKDKEIMLL
ncbi:hypothetical protein CRYUN_Cryun07bG0058000 [Craigia yunnanensis]